MNQVGAIVAGVFDDGRSHHDQEVDERGVEGFPDGERMVMNEAVVQVAEQVVVPLTQEHDLLALERGRGNGHDVLRQVLGVHVKGRSIVADGSSGDAIGQEQL